MSDEPTDLPQTAKVEPEPSDVRTILPKGHTILIGEKVFTLCMNTVVSGTRANIVAAGLRPE